MLHIVAAPLSSLFFFFNDTATTEIYTLSLHDALPIYGRNRCRSWPGYGRLRGYRTGVGRGRGRGGGRCRAAGGGVSLDRKSTRLNSSHQIISYAVFCLKKKKHSMKRDNA